MRSDERKEAINAYRERKIAAGIFAIRCIPTRTVWVGKAPDVSTIQSRLGFELSQGSIRYVSLQRAWREHGSDNLCFEVLEKFEEDESAYLRARRLQDRLEHHASQLGAERL